MFIGLTTLIISRSQGTNKSPDLLCSVQWFFSESNRQREGEGRVWYFMVDRTAPPFARIGPGARE